MVLMKMTKVDLLFNDRDTQIGILAQGMQKSIETLTEKYNLRLSIIPIKGKQKVMYQDTCIGELKLEDKKEEIRYCFKKNSNFKKMVIVKN